MFRVSDAANTRKTDDAATQRKSRFVNHPSFHTLRSVALMIARELIKEIVKRDAQTRLPG